MTEHDGTQPSTKQRKSRKTNTANQQYDKQTPAAQRPTNDDTEAWKTHWKAGGQSWRTEPEIDLDRQKYLAERRSITPNIEKGVYSFKDIKLSRADVEWLLATHKSGDIEGAVDWSDEDQRQRKGLDLRGANLRQANLSGLPLARIRGGLEEYGEWKNASVEQRNMAAVQLQGAYLRHAQLQGAYLRHAQLQGAYLREAELQEAYLWRAQLQEANLWRAQLQGAYLRHAQLQGAYLHRSDLNGANLDWVKLCDETYGSVSLADVRWGDVNLAVVDWGHVRELGDEQVARQEKNSEGKIKDKQKRLDEHKDAVRANRQLAVVLRNQGLNEEADRFAYRAQLLQRMVLWRQHEFGRWLFSMLLALLSGYGYRIWRILAAYIVVVSLFALVYFVFGRYYPPYLPLHQAFLVSITAFHGRVFLEQFNPDTPQIWFTALEATAGLIIEGIFIAMLIQRFFGK